MFVLNPEEKFDIFIDLVLQLICIFTFIGCFWYIVSCFFHWTIGNFLTLEWISIIGATRYIMDKERNMMYVQL